MSSPSSTLHKSKKQIENVLVLQGGGSLGAFGCGVYRALAKRNIKIDIVAGTSIGGVNAAIISGSGRNGERPEQALERFWLELSDGFVDLKVIDNLFVRKGDSEKEMQLEQLRSFASSALLGNDKMFKPRWRIEYANSDQGYFAPQEWTYLYDHSPLEKTLERYIDYKKLNPEGKPNTRLIVTATNVLTAQPIVFDSSKQQITSRHILATSGYPLYNFPWIEVEDGVYAWDGGLLSNTPLREAIAASPVNDKRIFLVENYPKKIDVLPRNLAEVYHRARDIIFCDKTEHNITMSKVITRYLRYIEELYEIVEEQTDHSKLEKKQLERIRRKYRKYKEEHGAAIRHIYYISREERFPHMYENADFSPKTIKSLIEEGVTKANQALRATREF